MLSPFIDHRPWFFICIGGGMKRFILPLCLLAAICVKAQDQTVKKMQADANKTIKKDEDTTGRKWRTGGLFSLNLTQGSLSNWAAGGDDFTLSLNSILSVYA